MPRPAVPKPVWRSPPRPRLARSPTVRPSAQRSGRSDPRGRVGHQLSSSVSSPVCCRMPSNTRPSWFSWTTRPAGLFRVTQGLHVATGIATIPLLFAKLWSVFPRLFQWPMATGVLHAVERLSLLPLVGGSLFMLVTGLANIELWYPWVFFFPAGHYAVSFVVMGALLDPPRREVRHHPSCAVARWSLGSPSRRRSLEGDDDSSARSARCPPARSSSRSDRPSPHCAVWRCWRRVIPTSGCRAFPSTRPHGKRGSPRQPSIRRSA